MKSFNRGLKAGMPIGLGYLSVSFSFGIIAISYGLEWWQAVLISTTTLTSAGQLAGVSLMVNPSLYVDMFLSQITVNIRYSFMSVSLSQKTSKEFRGIRRLIFGFFITDEIFAVASNEKEIMDNKLVIDKISSNEQSSLLHTSADSLIDSIYESIKAFEKEAITAGREYFRHKMNQCIAVTIYGISLMNELKALVLFAAFAYISFVLYRISKKFPKKA